MSKFQFTLFPKLFNHEKASGSGNQKLFGNALEYIQNVNLKFKLWRILLTHLPDGVINGWLLSSLSFLAMDLPQKCLCVCVGVCVCACIWGKGGGGVKYPADLFYFLRILETNRPWLSKYLMTVATIFYWMNHNGLYFQDLFSWRSVPEKS